MTGTFAEKLRTVNFRKGSGETLAFLPAMLGMLLILFYMVAFFQFYSSVNSIATSLETVGRAVSVCSSLENATEQAQRVAESIIRYNSVSNISTEVRPVDSGDRWDAGTFVTVTLSAYVNSMEPFFLSGTVSKKVLITVEYSDRASMDLTLTGADNAEKIFNYFRQKGFSRESAAAIVGNCVQESGCNPESEGSGGCGIAAFTPSARLKNQAALEGKDWRSLAFQLDYLLGDIPSHWYGEESTQTAEYIRAGIVEAGITFEDFKRSTDVKTAADVFCAYYEQCHLADAWLDVREQGAEAAYRMFK